MINSDKNPEVSVISDVHLATYASKAEDLLNYLKSICPKILVLNGDIIDAWRFTRNYFPKSHLKVIRQIIKMMENGTQVYYITGNHDEFLRRFEKIKIGNLQIINQLTLNLNGEKIWIFHGDIFDKVIHRTKWLAKIGAAMYGFLTIINIVLNFILNKFGNSNILLFKLLKDKFRKKNDNLTNYEKTITLFALLKGVNTVICGHTHNPADLMINIEGIKLHYLNCGDWVENNTAVEYHHGKWKLKYYRNEILVENQPDNDLTLINKKELYTILLDQFTTLN